MWGTGLLGLVQVQWSRRSCYRGVRLDNCSQVVEGVILNFLRMYLKIMEKLEKGTGILQTVSVAKYNEPA